MYKEVMFLKTHLPCDFELIKVLEKRIQLNISRSALHTFVDARKKYNRKIHNASMDSHLQYMQQNC